MILRQRIKTVSDSLPHCFTSSEIDEPLRQCLLGTSLSCIRRCITLDPSAQNPRSPKNEKSIRKKKWETTNGMRRKQEGRAWTMLQSVVEEKNSVTQAEQETNEEIVDGCVKKTFIKIIKVIDEISEQTSKKQTRNNKMDERLVGSCINVQPLITVLWQQIYRLIRHLDSGSQEVFIDVIRRRMDELLIFEWTDQHIKELEISTLREILSIMKLLKSTATVETTTNKITASRELLHQTAFINRISMIYLFDSTTISHLLYFTQQYITDIQILFQLQNAWINMLDSLSNASPYLFVEEKQKNLNIPSAHEILAILRFLQRFIPPRDRDSSTQQYPLLPNEARNELPIESYHDKETNDQLIAQTNSLQCYSDKGSLIEVLLGRNWQLKLGQLFSRSWDTAQPMQLVYILHTGWILNLINSINYKRIVSHLIDQQHLLIINNRATSDCRNLLFLLSMIQSSLPSDSFSIRHTQFLKRLATTVTTVIPHRINMCNLILFATSVVRLGLRVPFLRRRIVFDMQKGKTLIDMIHKQHGALLGKLKQLTPSLLLTALSHFKWFGINRSDESHTFLMSYMKSNIRLFTPPQLLLLLHFLPHHLKQADECRICLAPVVSSIIQFFNSIRRKLNKKILINPNDELSNKNAFDMNDGINYYNHEDYLQKISASDIILSFDSLRSLSRNNLFPLRLFQGLVFFGLNTFDLSGTESTLRNSNLDLRLISYCQLSRLFADIVDWNWNGASYLISALSLSIRHIDSEDVVQKPRCIMSSISVLQQMTKLKASRHHEDLITQKTLSQLIINFVYQNVEYLTPEDSRKFLKYCLQLNPVHLRINQVMFNIVLAKSLIGASLSYKKRMFEGLCKKLHQDQLPDLLGPPDELMSNRTT